ncbi:alanine--tRNA ligase [Dehalococcoidales bacterium]|nr:alanine--tRNA ligase [Dehalococcoidales bacterium]MCL0091563.1 alanine--tRNA ligase [Dehalococcoidales bacterium]
MTSDEIRTAFLSFFEEKGHKIIPSSSLIPRGDPTLLLTSAGMVPFKPYFLGEMLPPNPRLASCQKCFRTTDIELVGDPTHLTFFEMLGNFSIGDYFKQEAIEWAWEFVTQRLHLAPQQLWITIFLDDDESFHCWQKLGVPQPRIIRFGEQDNFWGPAGSSGPCGPCSEIIYDFGEEFGCKQPSCGPGCECGRFSEIWNLVFIQYNQDEDGRRSLLPKPNIDTGMGLERTVAVVEGKTSVYETNLFLPLLEQISELAGIKYGSNNDTDNIMRIIAEHSRGVTFLIGDGVIPSNEGRGYVLRRLLRRAAFFSQALGIPFAETANTTIEQMGHIYPELRQRQDFIIKVIELEEARFRETLNTGLELLAGIMEEVTGKGENKIPGKQAFKLYDTYGFPVELTTEIAADRGLSVDLAGFDQEMERQRERARATQKFEVTPRIGLPGEIGKTNFAGYQSLKHKSVIISLFFDNKSTERIYQGQEASLILETTPFYGEMGGQVGDSGEIRSSSGRFSVSNTIRVPPDIIIHQGYVSEGDFSVGDTVEAEVDEKRRLDIARNHTATHLLQLALRQVLGEHVQQRGSLVAPDRLRFDFSHLTAITKKEIAEVQHIVNEKVRQNLPVYSQELPYKKAIEEGAIALFDEKYGDIVRVVKIGEPVISAELCGGTHVASTGEIGFFNIIGESSIGGGLRRIEAVTGRGAEAFIDRRFSSLEKIGQLLGASPDDVEDKVSSLITELDKERKQALALERALAKKIAESLLTQAEVVNGVMVLAARVSSLRPEALREMSDLLREQLKSAVVVLGTVYQNKPAFIAAVTPDLVARGFNAGEIVKEVAKVTGGGGGGKPGLAQAGGKDKEKLDEALGLVKRLI